MGMPLPPLFKAEIKPISLSGFIEKRSGKVDLQFDAEICPSVTSLMVGTPLKLFMNLTTGMPPLTLAYSSPFAAVCRTPTHASQWRHQFKACVMNSKPVSSPKQFPLPLPTHVQNGSLTALLRRMCWVWAETSWGATRSARGKRLDSEGRCVLVGVARLPPSSDPITSTLLMLPTDALAVLQVKFEFVAK
jgi:hypothetical protein